MGHVITVELLPTDMLYLAYNDQEIVGFATAVLQKDALDLVGAAVKKQAQGSGIYSQFSLRRINFGINRGKNNVNLRTQNPRVELGIRLSLDSLANVGLISGYTISREIKEGLYGRMLTSVKPYCNIKEIDSLYAALNYERGDAFALQCTMKVRT